MRFLDALTWNWLIAGTDAHAKNYSLLLTGRQARLAPQYDIASALPYGTHERKLRLAMKIGGDYRHHRAEQARHIARRRPAFVLILAPWVDAQRLTDILLVDAREATVEHAAVVALDDDRAHAVELSDARARSDEAGASSRVEAYVLVQVVIIEAGDGGLEDMAGCGSARRDSPTSVLLEQSGLGLSARQTELTGEVAPEPRRRVLTQVSQTLRDFVLGKPRDRMPISIE